MLRSSSGLCDTASLDCDLPCMHALPCCFAAWDFSGNLPAFASMSVSTACSCRKRMLIRNHGYLINYLYLLRSPTAPFLRAKSRLFAREQTGRLQKFMGSLIWEYHLFASARAGFVDATKLSPTVIAVQFNESRIRGRTRAFTNERWWLIVQCMYRCRGDIILSIVRRYPCQGCHCRNASAVQSFAEKQFRLEFVVIICRATIIECAEMP